MGVRGGVNISRLFEKKQRMEHSAKKYISICIKRKRVVL